MAVGVICLRMGLPRNGAHPGSGYGVEDSLVRHFTFTGGDRHTAIQDIESEPIRAANERPDRLLEHRNFFCAIKDAHLIGATRTELRRRRGACLYAIISGHSVPKCGWLVVVTLPAMIVLHCRDIAPDDEVTLSPRSNCRRAYTTLSYAMRAMPSPGPKCEDHTTSKSLSSISGFPRRSLSDSWEVNLIRS